MRKIISLTMLLLGLSIAFTSCEKEPDPIPVTGITLDSSSLTLTEGETARLTATISPSNADNQGVIWSSSNASVASVSNGTVTAVTAGTAIITVKSDDGGKTATCNVTVNSKIVAVTGVSLDKSSLELTEGDEYTLVATVQPENASNKSVSWKSEDETIATVSDGKVKAIKPGSTTITVTTADGNKSASCSIKVIERIYHVESVSLDKSFLELNRGDEVTLVATVLPENATDKSVKWSSDNDKVATVNDGKIAAVAPGEAIITVTTTDGDKTATCKVTVKKVVPEGAVDLGLSVFWATCNLGASSPEEYGDYYAWGETETKTEYTEDTYKFYNSETVSEGGFDIEYKGYTKYIPKSEASQSGFRGFYDDKDILDPEDDVAHVKLGGKWKMPTREEFEELLDNCTWEWAEYKGAKGYKVTSMKNGYTDKWIFLPAAGFYDGSAFIRGGEWGSYWSCSRHYAIDYMFFGWSMLFDIDSYKRSYYYSFTKYERYCGLSVRPVCE